MTTSALNLVPVMMWVEKISMIHEIFSSCFQAEDPKHRPVFTGLSAAVCFSVPTRPGRSAKTQKALVCSLLLLVQCAVGPSLWLLVFN